MLMHYLGTVSYKTGVPWNVISFAAAQPHATNPVPFRAPHRKKGKKRKNLFYDPDSPESSGDEIKPPSYNVDTKSKKNIKLPVQEAGPNPLYDNRGHPDAETDYNLLFDESQNVNLVRKTSRVLPPTIDPLFDVRFNERSHGEYLNQHLHVGHLSPR